jgi:hypothetical protein
VFKSGHQHAEGTRDLPELIPRLPGYFVDGRDDLPEVWPGAVG